jgi:hypothetical protein
MTELCSIDILQHTLQALSEKQITSDIFCRTWREQVALLASLPPRYGTVMENLLSRLETASQFSEESCSYSQEDLLASLADWLSKAQLTLAAQTR